ncbi:MAG: hypothetical protein O2924_01745 [Chloroflexi bacterium]|nr:hypothetical protein [Chloroflexota bacterium]
MTVQPLGDAFLDPPSPRTGRRFVPKLVPPRRRADTVRRARLHALIEDALDAEVILITAPAGYGKSTLAVDWCDDAEVPLAWLSLDRQDADPLALVRNIVGAIRRAFPDALGDVSARLDAGAQPSGAAAIVAEPRRADRLALYVHRGAVDRAGVPGGAAGVDIPGIPGGW